MTTSSVIIIFGPSILVGWVIGLALSDLARYVNRERYLARGRKELALEKEQAEAHYQEGRAEARQRKAAIAAARRQQQPRPLG